MERQQQSIVRWAPFEIVPFLQSAFDSLLTLLNEPDTSGSSYMPPANRLLLVGMALSMRAKDILELGYSTGRTTLALALTGANVVAVDNHFEDSREMEAVKTLLSGAHHVTFVREDALLYLIGLPAESVDLVFLDDCHWPAYTALECIQLQRILRPGGVAAFHDVLASHLIETISAAFPLPWEIFQLPSIQGWAGYSGDAELIDRDFGLGFARKPHHG